MRADVLVAQLFDEFVEAHVSGGRPDVREYLRRAGRSADDLGLLIDRFLEVAPVEPADDETAVALAARLGHVTPLTAARTRLPLRLDELVERLRDALGLPEALRPRLRSAYQELEAGQLDPAGVDDRVWDALRAILGLDPRRLVAQPGPAFEALAFRRAADAPAPAAAPEPAAEDRGFDEVDVLFRGGRREA